MQKRTYTGVADTAAISANAGSEVDLLVKRELGDKCACFRDGTAPVTISSHIFRRDDLRIVRNDE